MLRSGRVWFFILLCGNPQGNSTAQSFTFAWLSDTHIGSPTGAEDLRRAVDDINAQADIAFAVLTGDITEMGSDAELALAQSILAGLQKPFHILPGNHDTKWSESGCTTFSKLWGSDRFSFDYDGIRFIGMHEGPIMRMGDGHFSPEDLRWLDSAIVRSASKPLPLIFLTHYPLDPSIDNWYEVLDRLRAADTRAVLCGHGHANKILNFEGLRAFMGRSNLRGKDQFGGYTRVTVRSDSLLATERIHGSSTLVRWGASAFTPHAPRHTYTSHPTPASAVNSQYEHVGARWTYKAGYTITAAPAICGNDVIACDRSGAVSCLSLETGSIRWRIQVDGAVFSTPDVDGDAVALASVDGSIYCLASASGRIVWRYQTGKPIVAAPRIAGGLVLVGSSDSTFRALDVGNGRLVWEFRSVGGFVETRSLVYRDYVMFGAWDTYLYALRLRDGSLAWKWSNGNHAKLFSPAACWPAAANGKVFVVAPDRAMTAIDAETGTMIWRNTEHQVRESIGISADGTRVYARSMTDTLFAFSSSDRTSRLLWQTVCGYGYDIDPSMPIERDGSVYFGTKNGLVVAVDSRTGVLRWIHKVGVTIVNTPAPAGNRAVVVTDCDGRVTMLEER